ncbi:MAG: Heme synthase, cytochrome oxidase biosis protein Cox15-CtaA [Labilithrix sp.]|nr:Heme synthase, cytochrome oxidase biosis protein Cox15-CtaA [Labilithrix sp.]
MTVPAIDTSVRPVRRLARFAWAVLAYNLLVIAWGALVRASGSGAGCGRHWPLCNGEVVPTPKSIATLIEAGHRATSGLALIAVVALMVWTLRALPRGHRARRASVVSTVFIFGEALIGAGLVLFELVAHDASMKRGLSMILHLGNTFLLLGALTITAWTIGHDDTAIAGSEPRRARVPVATVIRFVVGLSLLAILFLGSSGAIAALGDTLFPAASLREGMAQDFSPLAHVFLRLRVLHPFIALGTGALVFVTASIVRATSNAPRVRMLARLVTIVFATQFSVGLLNMTLLAPVAMQIVHLLLADATWIALVLMGWEALYASPAQSPIMSRNGPAPMSDVPPSTSSVDPVT